MKSIRINNLYIRKRTLPQMLTIFIFAMPFFLSALLDFLMLPTFLKYTIDMAWVGMLLATLVKRKIVFDRKLLPHVLLVLIFFLYTLVAYSFRFQSVAYYLWGFRNNFRYYVAFFVFTTYLEADDIDKCFEFMDVLFWVNAGVSFYQFLFLGYKQDFLGGIFGVERGCNAYSIIFFSVVLSWFLIRMMNGQENVLPCVIRCAVALIIAALAELKAFYLIFVMILVLAALFTSFSWKKCILFIVMGFFMFLGATLLAELFGKNSMLSFERMLELIFAKSYSTANDLGRMTAIPILSRTILTDPVSQLFGLGLGNCDTSAFAICNTPFYQAHFSLHYTWFSSAFLYLETGYCGLFMYVLFFFICLGNSLKEIRRDGTNKDLHQLSFIIAAVCIVLTIYNSSLRMEVGYIAYFALACPYISNGRNGRNTKE